MTATALRVAAVDLGATSGRVIAAEVAPDRLHLHEVHRFANEPVRTSDGLHWNVLELHRQILTGLCHAHRAAGPPLAGLAVDSWAVDYGLLRQGRLLGNPYHYRDEARTGTGPALVHQLLPHDALFARNGLQYLPFNTLYQLAADPWTDLADRMLLIPDLLGHWLTGGPQLTERTNASTTGLLDVRTGAWDHELIARLGLPGSLFGDLVDPGTRIGALRPDLARPLGLPEIPVTTVGSHDTASAVVAVPMTEGGAAFLSCGTWGLVGTELAEPVLTDAARAANFTNEGGVDGRVRFLTNVMGLWLLSESIRWWQRDGSSVSLSGLLAQAAHVPLPVTVFDVQDPRFLAPGDLPTRIAQWYEEHGLPAPPDRPTLVRAIVESLAHTFAEAVDRTEHLSGERLTRIHVVGGGALNRLLCQRLADHAGRPVLAGPVEATALGNVLIQARTAGTLTGTLENLRTLVARTHAPATFTPQPDGSR
ncbi:rhamnulokinase [Streptomyces candidus]|uniref:Rhamnulokinase n=1 Tax=Streptomyces candidus TaxID=67283 RepID=A0A7X0HKD6_9ACTN|nr:rhamnulokinase family protein [Streptomyces candidus]MBB6439281.1 rhamnulokinase [Streptomyces candidus]GHH44763.1 rhamnulokinase [Streptomyces candidus]